MAKVYEYKCKNCEGLFEFPDLDQEVCPKCDGYLHRVWTSVHIDKRGLH